MKSIPILRYLALFPFLTVLMTECIEGKNPCVAEWKLKGVIPPGLEFKGTLTNYFDFRLSREQKPRVEVELFKIRGVKQEEDIRCNNLPRNRQPWDFPSNSVYVTWTAVGKKGLTFVGDGLTAEFIPTKPDEFDVTFIARGTPANPTGAEVAQTNVCKVFVYEPHFKVEKNFSVLCNTNQLELSFDPSSIIDHVQWIDFQIQNTNSSKSYVIKRQKEGVLPWKPTASGHMDLWTQFSLPGHTNGSNTNQCSVGFPTLQEIAAAPGVKPSMFSAWQENMALAKTNARYEIGYFISLDTSNGKYGVELKHSSGPFKDNQNPSVSMNDPYFFEDTKRNPTPIDQLKYRVGWYHVHPVCAYYPFSTIVGPSGGDFRISGIFETPGFVYDFVGTTNVTFRGNQRQAVPAFYPTNSPISLYLIPIPKSMSRSRETEYRRPIAP